MSSLRWLLVVFAAVGTARAQWEILPSGSTADLRGIDAVGNGVAWASGTQGTVLRTTDEGKSWVRCATPPGAEGLDFRGVQAFDASTAIVMSSGKGDLSRLYKTVDGCKSWKLAFTNPDAEGFWDGILMNRLESDGLLLGDPVAGQFSLWSTEDKGGTWSRYSSRYAPKTLTALPGESVFAASNSSLTQDDHGRAIFGTGGAASARIFISGSADGGYDSHNVPLAGNTAAAGIFSIAFRTFLSQYVIGAAHFVAVGVDYTKASESHGTAAYSVDNGETWHTAKTPPHGYRSAVAYDGVAKAWVTVGPNGTDVSTDDGRNWRALRPNAAPQDPPDADQHWNALSLPFVVGPHGRIGKLRPAAITPVKP